MLALRPSCEHCNKALPPESDEAFICTYECTFCQSCVELLEDVCPNCGGNFVKRPIRPSVNFINGIFLGNHPATTEVTYKPVDLEAHKKLITKVKSTRLTKPLSD